MRAIHKTGDSPEIQREFDVPRFLWTLIGNWWKAKREKRVNKAFYADLERVLMNFDHKNPNHFRPDELAPAERAVAPPPPPLAVMVAGGSKKPVPPPSKRRPRTPETVIPAPAVEMSALAVPAVIDSAGGESAGGESAGGESARGDSGAGESDYDELDSGHRLDNKGKGKERMVWEEEEAPPQRDKGKKKMVYFDDDEWEESEETKIMPVPPVSQSRKMPESNGRLRKTPCVRCVKSGRGCYEQVGCAVACVRCATSKMRCDTASNYEEPAPSSKKPAPVPKPTPTPRPMSQPKPTPKTLPKQAPIPRPKAQPKPTPQPPSLPKPMPKSKPLVPAKRPAPTPEPGPSKKPAKKRTNAGPKKQKVVKTPARVVSSDDDDSSEISPLSKKDRLERVECKFSDIIFQIYNLKTRLLDDMKNFHTNLSLHVVAYKNAVQNNEYVKEKIDSMAANHRRMDDDMDAMHAHMKVLTARINEQERVIKEWEARFSRARGRQTPPGEWVYNLYCVRSLF